MRSATFFNKFSKTYESRGRVNSLQYQWMVKNILRQINKERCKVIDFGTGTGYLARRIAVSFPKSKVIGIDIAEGMINEARKKVKNMGIKNVQFINVPMEKFKIKRIDFAVSANAFHHVKNKKLVISKIYQNLTEDGKVIIADGGFKPSKEYEREIEKIRSKNPQRTKEFDKSWQETLKRMTREYKEKHPKEYQICPTELKDIMKNVGFRKQKILKSPLPNFAVVIGEK